MGLLKKLIKKITENHKRDVARQIRIRTFNVMLVSTLDRSVDNDVMMETAIKSYRRVRLLGQKYPDLPTFDDIIRENYKNYYSEQRSLII